MMQDQPADGMNDYYDQHVMKVNIPLNVKGLTEIAEKWFDTHDGLFYFYSNYSFIDPVSEKIRESFKICQKSAQSIEEKYKEPAMMKHFQNAIDTITKNPMLSSASQLGQLRNDEVDIFMRDLDRTTRILRRITVKSDSERTDKKQDQKCKLVLQEVDTGNLDSLCVISEPSERKIRSQPCENYMPEKKNVMTSFISKPRPCTIIQNVVQSSSEPQAYVVYEIQPEIYSPVEILNSTDNQKLEDKKEERQTKLNALDKVLFEVNKIQSELLDQLSIVEKNIELSNKRNTCPPELQDVQRSNQEFGCEKDRCCSFSYNFIGKEEKLSQNLSSESKFQELIHQKNKNSEIDATASQQTHVHMECEDSKKNETGLPVQFSENDQLDRGRYIWPNLHAQISDYADTGLKKEQISEFKGSQSQLSKYLQILDQFNSTQEISDYSEKDQPNIENDSFIKFCNYEKIDQNKEISLFIRESDDSDQENGFNRPGLGKKSFKSNMTAIENLNASIPKFNQRELESSCMNAGSDLALRSMSENLPYQLNRDEQITSSAKVDLNVIQKQENISRHLNYALQKALNDAGSTQVMQIPTRTHTRENLYENESMSSSFGVICSSTLSDDVFVPDNSYGNALVGSSNSESFEIPELGNSPSQSKEDTKKQEIKSHDSRQFKGRNLKKTVSFSKNLCDISSSVRYTDDLLGFANQKQMTRHMTVSDELNAKTLYDDPLFDICKKLHSQDKMRKSRSSDDLSEGDPFIDSISPQNDGFFMHYKPIQMSSDDDDISSQRNSNTIQKRSSTANTPDSYSLESLKEDHMDLSRINSQSNFESQKSQVFLQHGPNKKKIMLAEQSQQEKSRDQIPQLPFTARSAFAAYDDHPYVEPRILEQKPTEDFNRIPKKKILKDANKDLQGVKTQQAMSSDFSQHCRALPGPKISNRSSSDYDSILHDSHLDKEHFWNAKPDNSGNREISEYQSLGRFSRKASVRKKTRTQFESQKATDVPSSNASLQQTQAMETEDSFTKPKQIKKTAPPVPIKPQIPLSFSYSPTITVNKKPLVKPRQAPPKPERAIKKEIFDGTNPFAPPKRPPLPNILKDRINAATQKKLTSTNLKQSRSTDDLVKSLD